MYIKQIIIQGFKSYKDQTVIEPFSPKHNVVVGRNGSGKSNFFAAIRFVLSDAYNSLNREERQGLLHEGAGSAVMSAYVEIIFDNSDDRFPTGRDELILRRTIGLKKDEYSLDRKNSTKSEVMSLLESAGFSRSNPYYIVPQGRVTALTNMKDHERLLLLKEVAGTQVYEARRGESIRIMGETDSKRGKIDDLLSYIQERLGELEEEKEELRAYHDKDRERRCLEYTIYYREQQEINSALEELENMREDGINQSDQGRGRFQELDEQKSQFEAAIKQLTQQSNLLSLEKKQYEDERRDLSRKLAEVDFEATSIQAGRESALHSQEQQALERKQVDAAIQEREGQLQTLSPKYEQAKQQEKSLKSQLAEAESKRQRLFAKQGRNSRFKTKAERDKWLQKEIQDTELALATKKAVAMQTNEELAQVQKDIDKVTAEITELRQRILSRGDNMQGMQSEIQKGKDARDRLVDQRKELWREEARLGSSISNTRQEYDRAERVLSSSTDHNTSRGIAAVRRIKEQHGLDGVYGTLAELFKVSNKFKTAVEVTAGASLFHVVVDNDDTATRVLEILNKEKAGRVTFMPLNRLHPRAVSLPQANDAIPMIEKLDFDRTYTKAFQQVFGRTIVCPNLEIGSHYARSHGINAVTPEGDRSDNKGALTGGYHDPRSSSIDAIQDLARWREELDTQRSKLDEIRRGIEAKDQEVTKAVGELQKLEQRRSQAESSYEPLQREIRAKTIELQGRQDTLDQKRRNKDNIDSSTSDLSEQQDGYEAELRSEFKKELTPSEEKDLDELNATLPALRKKHMDLSSTRAELEGQKSSIELELRENLRPRQEQMSNQAFNEDTTGAETALKERQKDSKRLSKALSAVEKQLAATESSIEETAAELAENEQGHSSKMQELEELARNIERTQKRMEKSMAKKSLLTEKAAEATRNIRDLGVLPEEAFEKYTSYSSDKAIKRLHRVNDDLKKYSHVNKKAFEQYTNFTRQREQLLKRRTELDTSQQSIRDLIDVLDQRKDEAIERTFKQVSKEFASIFQRLVPAGKGRLVIQRKSDGAADDDDSEAERERSGSVENYTGVSIQVSFNSKHDEQQRIQQLSGGQKSLCALALVFAIQMCDPAPFYLFDEIDANLDAQYRTAVADLLQQISQNGQFICTTFRPEMVHVAEKCYGVTFSGNKTSRIDVVDRDAALGFVEGQISGA